MRRNEFQEAESVLTAANSDPHLAAARKQALIELYEATGRNEDAASLKRESQ